MFLKILPYILCIAVPSFFLIKYSFKLKKVIEGKEQTISNLRNLIVEIGELGEAKEDVENQKTEIKKKLDAIDVADINTIYDGRLPNIPRR